MITLRNITLTPQDEQDLRNVQPFVLTTEDVGKYDISTWASRRSTKLPATSSP